MTARDVDCFTLHDKLDRLVRGPLRVLPLSAQSELATVVARESERGFALAFARARARGERRHLVEFRLGLYNDAATPARGVTVSVLVPNESEATTDATRAAWLRGDGGQWIGPDAVETSRVEPSPEGLRLTYSTIAGLHARRDVLLPPTWIAVYPEMPDRIVVPVRVSSDDLNGDPLRFSLTIELAATGEEKTGAPRGCSVRAWHQGSELTSAGASSSTLEYLGHRAARVHDADLGVHTRPIWTSRR